MKVEYRGRLKDPKIEMPILSKAYTVKDGAIANMTIADFKALMASGDNSRTFVGEIPKVKED